LDEKLQIAGTYVLGKFDGANNTIYDLGVGTALARQPFGEGVRTTANSYGVQAAYQLSDTLALNAFGMYTDAQQSDGAAEAEIWSYGAGLSLPDLGKEGNLASIFVGTEPYEGNQEPPLHIQGMHKYQLNDNVSITPGVVYVVSPNGNEDDNDAVIGALRTTFTF